MAETFAGIQMTHVCNKKKRSLRVCSDAGVTAGIETFSPAIPSPAHLTTARLFHDFTLPFSAHGSFKKCDLHGPLKEMNIRTALAEAGRANVAHLKRQTEK